MAMREDGESMAKEVHVTCDRTRRSDADPAFVARADDMLERSPQVNQAVRLSCQVCMQGNAHHQRLAGGLPQHLLEVIYHQIGERPCVHLTREDHWNIVDFFRVRNSPQRLTVACNEARGLI